MRYIAVLFAIVVLTDCNTTPITRRESLTTGHSRVGAPELQKATVDSVTEFLLSSAASDFHMHGPSDVKSFRDVHIRYAKSSSGIEQYVLCGEYLHANEEGTPQWTPFVTIKTSGYEQWIGEQTSAYRQNSSAIRDREEDLSTSLQSRLDSLRQVK